MKRSGLITTKIGMTRLYDDAGVAHPVTVLSVGDCAVIGNRTQEKNGYVANILGLREAKAKHVAKPQLVAAEKAGVKPYRKVVEFRVSDDCVIPAGTQLMASHFVAGQFVDVQATSKGKGYQGAMKRHNFGGKEAYVRIVPCKAKRLNDMETALIEAFSATDSYNRTKGGAKVTKLR